MKYFIGAISVIVLLIIGYFIFIYSGMYNISAMVHHDKLTLWMMNTVRENSIKHNADDKIKMPDLSDDSLVKMGFVHYREMCVSCHGAPGIKKVNLRKVFIPILQCFPKLLKTGPLSNFSG